MSLIRRYAALGLTLSVVVACSTPLTSPSPPPATSTATSSESVAAPSPSPLPSPSPSAAGSQSARPSWSPRSEPIAFSSERYGYSLELPAGWYVRGEGPGFWSVRELSYVGQGTDSFEEDYPGRGGSTEDFPGVTFGLYVSSDDARGAMLDEWMDALAVTIHGQSSCQGDPIQEEATVAGEPAGLLIYDRSDCTHDHHVIVVGLLHGDAGFALTWLARQGEPDLRRDDFEAILRTFRFDD